MATNRIKKELLDLCIEYVDQRINTSEQAIVAAQASANEETKSSSGDKYETGRAMAQLEIEKNSAQLAEARKLKQQLASINIELNSPTIQTGSLVTTNQGTFFIAIPAGQLVLNSVTYFAVSSASPIATRLIGLTQGGKFSFNNKEYNVEDVI